MAIEEPQHHKGDAVMGDYETHPAFGQVTVSRVSGRAHLYGSDFEHANYVVVTLYHSELNRTLSRDWPFQRGTIAEFAMTEAQWATFVSSFNQGAGVQCTLTFLAGEGQLPTLPPPKRVEHFRSEANEDIQAASEALAKLRQQVAAATSGLTKKKADELLAHVRDAEKAINSSLPFVAKQFGEHMETTVEKMKAEVHGYISQQINRSGLAALQGQAPDVLRIDDGTA